MNAKDAIRQVREDQPPPDPAVVGGAALGKSLTPPAVPPAAVPPPVEPAAPAAASEGKWEPWMQQQLDYIRKRFIDERVQGFTHTKSGQYFGPVPLEQAEARWLKTEPVFRDVLMNDPEIRERFGGHPAPAPAAAVPVAEPPAAELPVEAPPVEPPEESSDAVTGAGDK